MHIKSLDGLRGIAVLMVVLFHYGVMGFGWIGVQIFFVLSGFLITRGLLKERDLSPSFRDYIVRFYMKRSLRIFPLYYAYILVVFLFLLIFGCKEGILNQFKYLITYTYNFHSLSPDWVNNQWFGHFWSLAIEEQFYMVWPFCVFFLRGRLLAFSIGVLVLCPILRSFSLPDTCYNSSFHQADSLVTGAIVAIIPRIKKSVCSKISLLSFIGIWVSAIVGIINSRSITAFGLSFQNPHNSVVIYTFINVFVASIIMRCLIRPEFLASILKNNVLVYIGKISYGIYVFHHPWLLIFKEGSSMRGMLALPIYLLCVLAVSMASYHLFESKFLKIKDRLTNQTA